MPAIALASVLALALSGCGANETPPPADLGFRSEPTVITMWTWEGTGHELLIDAYERAHPDVEVDVRISAFDQHHEGLAEALEAGGDVPDVALIERAYLPDFVGRADDFIDLGDFGAEQSAGTYLQWRWAEGTTATGAVLGLPTDVGGLAIAYRTDLFAQAGLPTQPDEVGALFSDWNAFLDTGRRFAESGVDAHFLDSVDSVFLARLGQASIAYAHADGTPAWDDSPGLADAWRLSVDAIDDGLAADVHQFSPEWNDAMADGGFAAIAAPSWMRGYLAGVAPDTEGLWALAPLPGVGGNWGGSQLTIPAGAEQPEAAWELIQHLSGEEAQLELFLTNGNFPSTPGLYDHPEVVALADPMFGGQVIGPLYIDSVSGLTARPTPPGERYLNRAFLDALFEVANGTPADEAWDDAVAEAETILAS